MDHDSLEDLIKSSEEIKDVSQVFGEDTLDDHEELKELIIDLSNIRDRVSSLVESGQKLSNLIDSEEESLRSAEFDLTFEEDGVITEAPFVTELKKECVPLKVLKESIISSLQELQAEYTEKMERLEDLQSEVT